MIPTVGCNVFEFYNCASHLVSQQYIFVFAKIYILLNFYSPIIFLGLVENALTSVHHLLRLIFSVSCSSSSLIITALVNKRIKFCETLAYSITHETTHPFSSHLAAAKRNERCAAPSLISWLHFTVFSSGSHKF